MAAEDIFIKPNNKDLLNKSLFNHHKEHSVF